MMINIVAMTFGNGRLSYAVHFTKLLGHVAWKIIQKIEFHLY